MLTLEKIKIIALILTVSVGAGATGLIKQHALHTKYVNNLKTANCFLPCFYLGLTSI